MYKFRTASRSAEQLTDAKNELNELVISAVRGSNGKYDKRGAAKLHENRFDVAELIVQLIQDEVSVTDVVPLVAEEVDGVFGNQYLFQEMNAALRVQPRAYGSKPLSQRLTWKEFSMTTTMKEVAVELPLEEIAVGRTTPSMVVEEMAGAINRYRMSTVLDALDAAVPAATADRSGVSGYTLRYTGFTKANLDKAIDGMKDDSNSPVIMGRHIALHPAIAGFAGWSEATLEELEKRGQIASYRGAPIVTLEDKFSRKTGKHVLRTDRIYIAGGDKGARFMTKDVSFLNYATLDEKSATFETGVRIEDGLLVWDAYRYRIIEIV